MVKLSTKTEQKILSFLRNRTKWYKERGATIEQLANILHVSYSGTLKALKSLLRKKKIKRTKWHNKSYWDIINRNWLIILVNLYKFFQVSL